MVKWLGMKTLWVDDRRPCQDSSAIIATSAEEAIALLCADTFTLVDLDYDLGGGGTGADIIHWIADNQRWPANIRIHSKHAVGVAEMARLLDQYLERSAHATWSLKAQPAQ